MHACLRPRQPAWVLARGATRLRLGVWPNAFGNALGESIAGANGQSSRSAGGSDSLDAFLALNDNFSGSSYTFADSMAGRRVGNNPMGLPTYSDGAAVSAGEAAASGGKGITQIVAELSQPRAYTAQSRDTISSILGTSDPQAIGNFMRANDLRSSTVYAGQDYVIPGAMNALGDNSAFGQNALNVDNSRLKAIAAARDAQAATYRNENYGNEGRSRPTYSSSSYDDMSWLSRRGNAVETAASTTALQGIYDEYGLMTNPAAAPIGQVVAGVMFGGARVLAEPVLQVGDLLQVANEMGRSLVTGEGPRDIGYMSMVGQAAGQGTTTTQIANGGMYSLLKTPDRIIENFQKGDYYAAGEDIGGVGVGLGFAAAGAPRGAGQNFVAGSRLAMEDSFAVAGSIMDDALRPMSPRERQRGSVSVDLLTGKGLVSGSAIDASTFVVDNHGDMPSPRPGQNSHHGVMSAWMEVNYPNYNPDLAPAVLMPEANHRATFGVYNTWRAAARREMGGTFDWANVSEPKMRDLSGKMFDAAKVPTSIRQQYWDRFDRMTNALSKNE